MKDIVIQGLITVFALALWVALTLMRLFTFMDTGEWNAFEIVGLIFVGITLCIIGVMIIKGEI